MMLLQIASPNPAPKPGSERGVICTNRSKMASNFSAEPLPVFGKLADEISGVVGIHFEREHI